MIGAAISGKCLRFSTCREPRLLLRQVTVTKNYAAVPDGNTQMQFACGEDGAWRSPVQLPLGGVDT
jgi:hypothetical protein